MLHKYIFKKKHTQTKNVGKNMIKISPFVKYLFSAPDSNCKFARITHTSGKRDREREKEKKRLKPKKKAMILNVG